MLLPAPVICVMMAARIIGEPENHVQERNRTVLVRYAYSRAVPAVLLASTGKAVDYDLMTSTSE